MMRKSNLLVVVIVLLEGLLVTSVNCEVLMFGALVGVSAVAHYYGYGYSYVRCKFQECCTEEYVHPKIEQLDALLSKRLYGQEIAHETVVSALRGHIESVSPPKALSMSFHGPPGTGKTFVTRLIAEAFYQKGTKSGFYHFFNGRSDFPLERLVEEYKVKLRNIIVESLTACDKSIFVFDEVDKMPAGLLDVLVPFLDYTSSYKLQDSGINTSINKTNAIYIFLSNSGSTQIMRRMLNFWEEGRRREELRLDDFETVISMGAFNEKGGFYYSDTIEASLIDHYVPFLPLEESHVRSCLKRAFRDRSVKPTEAMMERAMNYVTFGPEPHKLYSYSGCKRLEQKVAAIIHSKGSF